MKDFLKHIFRFITPLLIIITLFEVALRMIPNMYSYKSDFLKENCSEIETLILGDSHAMYGFNPKFIKGFTFNASHVSQSLDIDYEILKKHENCFKNLKHVIIRLSYTTLFEKLSETNEDWRLKDYILYYKMNLSNRIKYRFEFLSVKLNNNVKRLYDFYINDDPNLNWDKLGWGTDARSEKSIDPIKLGENTAKRHTIVNHKNLPEFVKVFESIVQICKSRGVEVVVVTLPAHSSYVSNLESVQLNKTINFGKSLSERNSNCKYFNLLNDKRFVKSDFFDADHLNEVGAKKLSLIINEFL